MADHSGKKKDCFYGKLLICIFFVFQSTEKENSFCRVGWAKMYTLCSRTCYGAAPDIVY